MEHLGKIRFRGKRDLARKKELEHTQGGGMALYRRALLPAIEGIEAWMTEAREGRAGYKTTAFQHLREVDSALMGVICLREILSKASQKRSLQAAAIDVGTTLQEELRASLFEEQEPGFWKRIIERLESASNNRYRRRVITHAANRFAVPEIEWSKEVKLVIGKLLLEIVAESTGIFEITKGQGKLSWVELHDDALEFIVRRDTRCELLEPVFLPTRTPPKEWTGLEGGGLLSRNLSVIKLKGHQQGLREELKNRDMTRVLRTINALQSTPWRVNRDVLEVMTHFWELGGARAGLVTREKDPLPQRPLDIDSNEESLRKWKTDAREVYDRNSRRKSKVLAQASTMWLGEKYKDASALYFIHTIDFRGRAYPMTFGNFQPQGPDDGRGLLEFAAGVPLGVMGIRWLAIHGANSFGEDKCPLLDRERWVAEHEQEIFKVAADPYTNQWWMDADAPWQFLAFCFEWSASRLVDDPKKFLSHLPVSIDGSCSGIQHYSAMLLDPVGGRAVNLTADPVRQDIYMQVLSVTKEYLERSAGLENACEDEERHASWWLQSPMLNRKMIKRPVMTLPYGATKYGFTDQIIEEMTSQSDGIVPEDAKAHAIFLAGLIWAALDTAVVGARTAMEWLHTVASVAAKTGKALRWASPCGLLVEQDYRKTASKQVLLHTLGERVKIRILSDTNELDSKRMSNGIAPNFVHSLDAAHMIETLSRCLDSGIYSLGAIHDCFTTHAGNMEQMREHTRQAFVDQYQLDRLEMFRQDVLAQLPPELAAEVPPPPPRGTLDLSLVLQSDFFFA